MRIAHVTDCYLPRLGGIELQVHDLAQRQAAQGHEVSVITTTGRKASAHVEDGVEVIRVAPRWTRSESISYPKGMFAVAGLRELLMSYDAVHSHISIYSPLATRATWIASRAGVPTVATSHSMWDSCERYMRHLRRLTRWANLPAVFTAVSNAAAERPRQVIGPRAAVHVVHNGVDPQRWQVEHEPGDGHTVRIAVVSRLTRRKRIAQLVEMLRIVNAGLPQGLSLDVSVMGDGDERSKIERHLRRHSMDSWVRLLGRCDRDQIRSVFARSDLFIAPATLESFGIAALEARCAGLPVLAMAGTGVADFIVHGREGWLVPSDDAMVETLSSLVRSPEVLARVAAHNRTAPSSVSWESVLHACERTYAQAAAMHNRTLVAPSERSQEVAF
jgi:glycosyltransferase involved in cell wall biosynthesis